MYHTRLTLFLRRDLHQKKKSYATYAFFLYKKATYAKKKKFTRLTPKKKKLRDLRQKKINKKATYAHFHNRVTLLILPPALKRRGSPIRQG